MKELGVGLVYFQGFEDFLTSHSSLIDVVEIEPQTLWYDRNDGCDVFKYDHEIMAFLKEYKRAKLFHGVGFPVGGTFTPPAEHFNTLRQQSGDLNPEWVSEHLSFNYFREAGRDVNSGFLLPPLQSAESVKTAAANIRHYRSEMDRPFAFETGVNYLKPRKNEIPDGLFVSKIAEEADCYILLDLHNILANHRNGRQSVTEFLSQLDYERVIELHVANGVYYKDYYLDAHSGTSDTELLEILENLVSQLPDLKALMFEINSDYFRKVPESEVCRQLEAMHRIWDKKGRSYKKIRQLAATDSETIDETVSVNEWELTLGKLVLGRNLESKLAHELQQDKGIEIIKDIVFNFRGSTLVSMFKLSTRLLRLSIGEPDFNRYVTDFFDSYFPELLPIVLATQFSDYVRALGVDVPYLEKIMAYELALIRTAIDKQDRSITFDFDPAPVIAALEGLRLPDEQPCYMEIIVEIAHDRSREKQAVPEFAPVIHN